MINSSVPHEWSNNPRLCWRVHNPTCVRLPPGALEMAQAEPPQQIAFQVHDIGGHAHSVLLRVDEKTAQGRLAITASAAGETQQHELTQLQKSRDGKTLMCKASMATVTFTIEDEYTPPRLHLV